MEEHVLEGMSLTLPQQYINQITNNRKSLTKKFDVLVRQRKVPKDPWTDKEIELFLYEISLMDSNNFPHHVGVGEREGRVKSDIINRRYFGLAHGIGRSGDVTAVQPKAIGSSFLVKLANSFSLDMIRSCGLKKANFSFLVPLSTGMAISLVFLSLRQRRPRSQFVLWSRIDQKTCFKCILTAGFTPVVVELVKNGDQLQTDLNKFTDLLNQMDAEDVLCVFATTSCFAPRAPDRIPELAEVCRQFGVPLVVNNAYGVQCGSCMGLISQGASVGRVDAVVQSTDKNFMVPVGGAIIAGFDQSIGSSIAETYSGRAGVSGHLDLVVSLLSIGLDRYRELLEERRVVFRYLKDELSTLSWKYNLRVLSTPKNSISIAMAIDKTCLKVSNSSEIGSMLFYRQISGCRVVVQNGPPKNISGHIFQSYGSHCDHYSTDYITCAAAIGIKLQDVEDFISTLDTILGKVVINA